MKPYLSGLFLLMNVIVYAQQEVPEIPLGSVANPLELTSDMDFRLSFRGGNELERAHLRFHSL
jgi:hypothetical protein